MPTRHKDPILDDLNEPQRQAVTYGEGPLLVVAGAGSGKTRVITRRVAHLVREGVQPQRVLAITFTNKAADEMRRRVEALVGRNVQVMTFHAFCAWLLRRDIQALGWDKQFTIYDRPDSRRLIREIIKSMDLDRQVYRPSDILDAIGVHKERLEGPDQCTRGVGKCEAERLAQIYRSYNERLAASNALDFDDLLAKTVELFNARPEVLQRHQEHYLHVLVDEYQDTNLPQHLIARALQGRHRNITAVGDPDQMIYTWRGARLENILEFETDFPGTHVITLERNYRSTANILRAASTCVGHNRLRREKVLWTDSPPGEPVRVVQFMDARQEAEFIAETVQRLIEGGLSPAEIAVLYRTKYHTVQLEEAFATRTLPYQVVDTVGFFERKEVKDLRAYIQLLVNDRDDAAFERIVNVPARGIGDKTLDILRAAAQEKRQPLLLTALQADRIKTLDERGKRALAAFCEFYQRLASLKCKSIHEFVKQLLAETHYIQRTTAEEREDAKEVIEYFEGYAKEFDKRHPGGTLVNFMEQTALVNDVDGWKAGAKAVSMMTLHSAKGLEFDVVLLSGLEEGILPHERALKENRYGDEDYALEEERRLLHVGMTRARKRLYMTHVCRRLIRGMDQPVMPSRFVYELPEDGVERHTIRDGAALPEEREAEPQHRAPAPRKTIKLTRKAPLLQVLDEQAQETLTEGVRVRHASYGEGVVVGLDSAGKHHLVRVDFGQRGVLTFLMAP